ncbi:MAG: DUF3017 domain-containing protein [Pseudonocardiales bacterium]|jgi:hypothetical protein|nr:DUF3017 domain-containing protein [Pseudonocardiales bacterium]
MRLPSWAPTALVLLIAAAGMGRVLMEHWRQGGVLLGGALIVAAVLRVALRPEEAGLLVVRSKVLDVLGYAALGVAMVLLAITITDQQLTIT